MLIIQSTSYSVVVRLVDVNGNPVVNLTTSSISAYLKKEGEASFTVITLTGGSNFSNNGNGYYTITLSALQTNVLGSLYLLLRGDIFQDSIVGLTVATAGTAPPASPVVSLNKTVVYGSIVDSAGLAASGVVVTLNLLNSPTIVTSGSDGVGVTNGKLVTKTDSQGYFTLSAVTNLTYEVIIPAINFRRIITPVNSTPLNVFGV
jgi:hypothetical protein